MYLTPPTAVVDAHNASLSASGWFLIALAVLAPFAFYFDTARSIVAIWNSSETFAHGYVIVPISLWLLWGRRDNFKALPPAPWWPALWLLAAAGAGWLLARMGEVQVVQQYALVSMVPLIALAVLGRRLAGSLTFPLLFLLFAVPFGEVFIGPLIEFTADFTIAALQMTGIPVLRTGTRFEIPTGNWSVVEACSGVRYLISSVTLGSLFAYLTYRSTSRRVMFVAASVVVPIIANGLRAYMIVMIGHTSDMKLAVGVDHLIYGWVFFGIVMFLMFWVGSYWREDDATPAAPVPVDGPARNVRAQPLKIVVAVVMLSAVWPLLAHIIDRASYNPAPVKLERIASSWAPGTPFSSWKPRYMDPDARLEQVYRGSDGRDVALDVLYYRNQENTKALISSVNVMAGENDPFHVVSTTRRKVALAGGQLEVREHVMRGKNGDFLVWQWMSVDGRPVLDGYAGKLLQARMKLMLRGDDGAAVMVSTPSGERPDEARAALRAFLDAHVGAIDAALEAARR